MTREELDALHGRSGEAMTRLSHLSGSLGDTDFIARFIADARRLLSDLRLKELDDLEADLRSGNASAQIRAAAGIVRMFSPPSDAEIELSDQDLQEMIDKLRLGETVSVSFRVSQEDPEP